MVSKTKTKLMKLKLNITKSNGFPMKKKITKEKEEELLKDFDVETPLQIQIL